MDFDALFFQIIFVFIFAFLGLCLGSFSTAIIHREKYRQSWFDLKGSAARSSCPRCNAKLTPADLVPVFSWLWLKGKCRYCHGPISAFYPFIEIVSGIGAVLIFLSCGLGVSLIAGLLILPFAISFVFLCAVPKLFSFRLLLVMILIGSGIYFLQMLQI